MADKKPGRGRKITRRMSTVLVGALAGLLFVAAATTSHGSDLRPTRQQDMADLVAAQATHNSQARSTASALQSQVNELSNLLPATDDLVWDLVLGSALRSSLPSDPGVVAAVRAEFLGLLTARGVTTVDAGTLVATAVVVH